jgi:hypothetical protein
MPLTRRGFLESIAARGNRSPIGDVIAARGHEDYWAEQAAAGQAGQTAQTGQAGQGRAGGAGRGNRPALPDGVEAIRISSNENPLGPGKAVLDAIVGKFPEAGRYPFNSTPNDTKLVETIAALYKAKPENIVVGAG